ncbi:MAG: cytidylate kinase family protein, partial [Anaerovoracaceae bacterium]|nr:cytidylate kinase family protein [Anaerovoracaceae bacterium]
MKNQHHVITIGRQLGSGGSAMGKAIAEHFGFEYIDKEILVKAAAILDADEENLELVDENVSALTAMARSAAFEMPYIAKEWYI